MLRKNDLRAITASWANRKSDFNVFLTVTLKQAIQNDAGGLTYITHEDCQRTAWLLRDRLLKAIRRSRYGRQLRRQKADLPFLPSIEGGDGVERYHLHIATARPPDMPLTDYTALVKKVAARLDWTYHEIDVQPVRPGTELNTLRYSLKEGIDSLCPEATKLPVTI